MLCQGDITKKSVILNFTLDDVFPFIKYNQREYLFREAILHLLGAEDKELTDKLKKMDYCRACKKTSKRNCLECDKNIRVTDGRISK